MFGTDNTWWRDDINKIIKTIHLEALVEKQNLVLSSAMYNKTLLICLDIGLSAIYDQFLQLYDDKDSSVIESSSRVCLMLAASERINEAYTKMIVKNDVRRFLNSGKYCWRQQGDTWPTFTKI